MESDEENHHANHTPDAALARRVVRSEILARAAARPVPRPAGRSLARSPRRPDEGAPAAADAWPGPRRSESRCRGARIGSGLRRYPSAHARPRRSAADLALLVAR